LCCITHKLGGGVVIQEEVQLAQVFSMFTKNSILYRNVIAYKFYRKILLSKPLIYVEEYFWIEEQHHKAAQEVTTYAQRKIFACNSKQKSRYIETSYLYIKRSYCIVQGDLTEIWIESGVSKIQGSRDIF